MLKLSLALNITITVIAAYVLTLTSALPVLAEPHVNPDATYEVQGAFGDAARKHNNGDTLHNADYDFEHPRLPTDTYRFTGDNQLGETEKSHQHAVQRMVRGQGGRRLMTQTGLLSPDAGPSFAGPASMGFTGATDGFYDTIYQGAHVAGNRLRGTGTGQLSINILDGDQFSSDGKFQSISAASRLDVLRAYVDSGKKLTEGSISAEEAAQLKIGQNDYFTNADYAGYYETSDY